MPAKNDKSFKGKPVPTKPGIVDYRSKDTSRTQSPSVVEVPGRPSGLAGVGPGRPPVSQRPVGPDRMYPRKK